MGFRFVERGGARERDHERDAVTGQPKSLVPVEWSNPTTKNSTLWVSPWGFLVPVGDWSKPTTKTQRFSPCALSLGRSLYVDTI